MPYELKRIKGEDLYKVYNTETGKVHSMGSTLENAKKQINLLNRIEAGKGMDNFDSYSDYPKLQRDLRMSVGSGFYYRFR